MASNANPITPITPPPIVATVDTPKPRTAQPQSQPAVARTPDPLPASDPSVQADYRLVIDEDPKSGTFIYKTVNPATGDVIYQVPREELLRLRDNPSYQAGSVVKTRA